MNEKIKIIGYSGHAYVCIETGLLNNISTIGYYDKVPKDNNPYKLKYLGKEKNLSSNLKVFICIAENNKRKNIYKSLTNFNFNINLIHPNTNISNTAKINSQSLICSGAIINPQSNIGTGCIINTGVIVEHDCQIGDFSHIAPGSVLLGGVSVGNGSFIGANSVIKQGVSIGKNVIIGAGSVVIKDILDNTKVAGNPIKKI